MKIHIEIDTDDDMELAQRMFLVLSGEDRVAQATPEIPAAPAKRRGRPPKAKDVYSIAREKLAERVAK